LRDIETCRFNLSLHEIGFTIPYAPSGCIELFHADDQRVINTMRKVLKERFWSDSKPLLPRHGYRRCISLSDGAYFQWASGREAMGLNCRLTGQWLDYITLEEQLEIIKRVIQLDGHTTHIDIAFDVYDLYSVDDFVTQARRGKFGDARRKISVQEDLDTGAKTLYVGTRRKSNYFLRVYDKAKQKKLDMDWTRFELECKHKAAKLYGSLIARGCFRDVIRDVKAKYKCILWYLDATPDDSFRLSLAGQASDNIWAKSILRGFVRSVLQDWTMEEFVNAWNVIVDDDVLAITDSERKYLYSHKL